MRARIRKRQQMRRFTILATVIVIAVSLGVGIYFATTAGQGTQLDASIGKLVTASEMASLVNVSTQPYGPAASAAMQNTLQKYGGTPFLSAGKPTIVFIGGEFCPFCAVERWSLVMALMRFGSFTNLHYTTSADSEGDYATFTFVGSSYASQYISFRPYEASDRNRNPLQTVPSNYSGLWGSKAGGGVPFVNFGNAYLAPSSIIADPSILTGKNWTSILGSISASDGTGVTIREGANLITAIVCKLTQGQPAAVCSASPIGSEVSSIAGPVSVSLQTEGLRPSAVTGEATPRPFLRRLG